MSDNLMVPDLGGPIYSQQPEPIEPTPIPAEEAAWFSTRAKPQDGSKSFVDIVSAHADALVSQAVSGVANLATPIAVLDDVLSAGPRERIHERIEKHMPSLRKMAEVQDPAGRQLMATQMKGILDTMWGKGDYPIERYIFDNYIDRVAADPQSLNQIEVEVGTSSYRTSDGTAVIGTRPMTSMDAMIDTQKWIDKTFSPDPEMADWWTVKVAGGVGSSLPFIFSSMFGGLPLNLTTSALSGMGEAAQRAYNEGATPEDLLKATILGSVPGLTESAPIELLFRHPPMRNALFEILLRAGEQALAEGSQEVVQQAMQNWISNYVMQRDEDIFKGVEESFTVGGGAGFVMEIATQMLGLRAKYNTLRRIEHAEEIVANSQAALTGEAAPVGIDALPSSKKADKRVTIDTIKGPPDLKFTPEQVQVNKDYVEKLWKKEGRPLDAFDDIVKQAKATVTRFTGGHVNDQIVLKAPEGSNLPDRVVGPVSPQQWEDFVGKMLNEAEIVQAAQWYRMYNDFMQIWGPDKAGMKMSEFLIQNQAVSPETAMAFMLRVDEQVSRTKQGLFDIASEIQSKKTKAPAPAQQQRLMMSGQPFSGVNYKISDFYDSAAGKATRSVYGDDPKYGGPHVIDIHQRRVYGMVDSVELTRLRELGYTGTEAVQLDITDQTWKQDDGTEVVSPQMHNDRQYEYLSDYGNWLTKKVNEQGWMGRNEWTDYEIQAITWAAKRKWDNQPSASTIQNAIQSVSHTIPLGLESEGRIIPPDEAASIVGKLATITGTNLARIDHVAGGWTAPDGTQVNVPTAAISILATDETADLFTAALGYVTRQKAMVDIQDGAGRTKAKDVAIIAVGDMDPLQVFKKAQAIDPDLVKGWTTYIDPVTGDKGVSIVVEKGKSAKVAPRIDAVIDGLVAAGLSAGGRDVIMRRHDGGEEGKGYKAALERAAGQRFIDALDGYSNRLDFGKDFTALRNRAAGDGQVRLYRGRGESSSGGVRWLNTFEVDPSFKEILDSHGYPAVTFNELDPAAHAADFHATISKIKASNPFGASVYVYPVEEYAGMRLFTSQDGKSGFAIKPDGDLVSVFSSGGGSVYSLLGLAIEQGATKLDAFDTVLPEIYASVGFKEVGRDKWNEAYKPEGWDYERFAAYNNGRPDVVYMQLDGAAATSDIDALPDASTVATNPSFKEWFGDSKAVDADGKPRVYFRGMQNRNEAARVLATSAGIIWFGADPATADIYAGNANSPYRLDGRPQVYPVFLKTEAPLDLSNEEINSFSEDGAKTFLKILSDRGVRVPRLKEARSMIYYWEVLNHPKIVERIKEAGYDSVMILEEGRDTIAVFDPKQIKSVYNRGTFDPADPNIDALPDVSTVVTNPSFKQWFGNSKVVDGSGKPMPLFHGTGNDITAFEGTRQSQNYTFFGQPFPVTRHGIFLTESPGYANEYALMRMQQQQQGRVMPLFAKIENPIDLTDNPWVAIKADPKLRQAIDETFDQDAWENLRTYSPDRAWELFDDELGEKFVSILKDAGYDGAKTLEAQAGFPDTVVWVALDPKQIKSVYNKGSFDPTVERIDAMAKQRPTLYGEPVRGSIPEAGAPKVDYSRRDMMDLFQTAVDSPVRPARLRSRDNLGEFNRSTGVIRVQDLGRVSDVFHEGGHALHDLYLPEIDGIVNRHLTEMADFAARSYTRPNKLDAKSTPREAFAEFMRLYITAPAKARVEAPGFMAEFEAWAQRRMPDRLEQLRAVQQQFANFLIAPDVQVASDRIVSSAEPSLIQKVVSSSKEGTILTDMHDIATKMYTLSVDKNHPILRGVEAMRQKALGSIARLKEAGMLTDAEVQARVDALDLKAAENPWILAQLATNSSARAHMWQQYGVEDYNNPSQVISKSLSEAIVKAHGNNFHGRVDPKIWQDFGTYLAFTRIVSEWRNYQQTMEADQRAQQGLPANYPKVKRYRPPIDLTLPQALQTVADLEARNPQFKEAAVIARDFFNGLWTYQRRAGLITEEIYQAGLAIDNYAPLKRRMGDSGERIRTGGDGKVGTAKRFRGSSRDIINPLEAAMLEAYALSATAAKNDVMNALARYATRTRGGAIMEPIPNNGITTIRAEMMKVMAQADEQAGLDFDRDDVSFTRMAEEYLEGNATARLFLHTEINPRSGEQIVYTWNNGERQAYVLADGQFGRDLYNALANVSVEQSNMLVNMVGMTSQMVRMGITTAPEYLFANYIRDQVAAWVLTDVGFTPFVSGAKGLREEIMQTEATVLYNRSMAPMGGTQVSALNATRARTDMNDLVRKGYAVKHLSSLEGVLKLTEATETGTRLALWKAAYDRARASGMTEKEAMAEAAWTAMDTANFGRHGSGTLWLRRTIPFMNAQIQGLDKMSRTLAPTIKEMVRPYIKDRMGLPLSAKEKADLKSSQRAWVKVASLSFVSALAAFMYFDDDEYWEQSDYLRMTHWSFKLGDGSWVFVPKPFELAIMANMTEYAIAGAFKGDRTAFERFVAGSFQTIMPPTDVPAFTLASELWANKDTFTGREIVPDWMQVLPAWMQQDQYTSELGKALGKAIGVSPKKVDHVITSMLSSWGRLMLTSTNVTNPNRPAMALTDAPLFRRFVKDPARGGLTRDRWQKQMSVRNGAFVSAARGYKMLMDSGQVEEAQSYFTQLNPDLQAWVQLSYFGDIAAKRLHPMRRADDVVQTANGIRKELFDPRGVATGKGGAGGRIVLTPGIKRKLDDRLADLMVREQRNTLVLMKAPGYEDRGIVSTELVFREIEAISPEVAREFRRRLKEDAKVRGWEAMAAAWPAVRAEVLQRGAGANWEAMKGKAMGGPLFATGDAQ